MGDDDSAQGSGRLAGRRVLVTGAASGIGRAAAVLFVREGARVAALDRDERGLSDIADGLSIRAFPCDLVDGDAIDRAVADAGAWLGGLDGIINCAGISSYRPLEEIGPDLWRLVMAINLDAPYRICRAALPLLRQASMATIVNVASGQALLPNTPGGAAYAASKAGVLAFTKALGAELAPRIRANVLCPGVVRTPMVSNLLDAYDNPDDAPFVQQYALKRAAEPEEMAQALLFLTSKESSYVTGTVLAADGGRTFH